MEHSTRDSKQTNSLSNRGNSILKTFLPESLKTKPKLPTVSKGREIPNLQSEKNLNMLSEEMKCPGTQQQCQTEGKPLARIAMVNNMLSKTSAENEVFLLKRGSSGSSEGRRRRSIPHRITHSASDTACNRGETTKPEAKKRRSMSDYLDMKNEKQSIMLKEKANLRKNQIHKQPCNDFEQKSEQTPTATRKEESNKPQVKNKINLIRGKLPSVTTWTNKPNDTQTADTKQKEGKVDDITKEKGEVKTNTMKTRKTSTDIIKNAFQRKVNTMSGIQSWKLNTFKHKELPNDNLTKTEEMLKDLMQGNSDTVADKLANEKLETVDTDAVPFDHKKITLSVKKLTPIPSEEYQSDSDVDGSLITEKENLSSPQSLTSGRGILKKVSNVEIPNLEVIQNQEATIKAKEETNNSPSRMVKFDMPSFDSQTSEELPSITIDLYDIQEGRVKEVPNFENFTSVCDKATETETAIDVFGVYKPTDNDTDKLYDHIWSIIKKDESNKEVILKTVKDVFGILAGLDISQNEDEPNANDSSANDLTNQKTENMAELEKAVRSIVNINMIMIENKIEPIITQTNIIEEEEEPLEQVQTHTLVLENVDISILNNLKDQLGDNIKQSEVHEDTSEESEEAEEIKAKTQTCHSRYHNLKNVRKCFSCPNLPGEKQAEFSDSAFTQTFVQQCQEEAEDVGISEDQLSSDIQSPGGSDDSLHVDMEIIRNCLFIRETQIVDDFVIL